jgi:3-dehydroquinate synthase
VARVEVPLPGRAYPVLVSEGALDELPALVRALGAPRAAVVTDEAVAELWAGPVVERLEEGGLETRVHAVRPGEASKSIAELERVLGFLEAARIDRASLVVALGGGTVGDLAGFAAAVWLRGVRCLQVPTTLLAMVDSSIGGKTGVNTARTKNAVGAFWQPAAVVADLRLLATLPQGELEAAFGEVVKYAVALDAELAEPLASGPERLLRREAAWLEPVVARCAAAKARVVAEDERDRGGRAVLNYGHTVGHAVEVASGYAAVHGRAVALGRHAAARMAARLGLCAESLVSEQDRLLAGFGLPGRLPLVEQAAVLEALPRDKKARDGAPEWVLPRRLGRAEPGHRVPEAVVAKALEEVMG